MKKIILILLVLSLILPVVEAKLGNITKTDFYIESRQAYRLEQGDGISFTKDNKEYVISVDEIGKDSLRLKSFAYKNDSRETFYIILSQKFSNKIDFEKDNVYDMNINLLKIWNINDTIKADLLFETLKETKTVKNVNNTQTTSNKGLTTGLIITASIIILGLFVYFILRKK